MSAKGGANLPLARVKTIMKSSPEVENVNQESLFLVTRATVSFYKSQFRKRQFVRDKNTQKNASKFAIFIEKEFSFFISSNSTFLLMNAWSISTFTRSFIR